MVKSEDTNGTTTVTNDKKGAKDVVTSVSHDLHEEEVEDEGEEVEEEEYGEMTSPAPVILGEKGIPPNRTGNNNII